MTKRLLPFALAVATPFFCQGPSRGPQPRPVVLALDADHNGVLSAAEITAAPRALLTLDTNGDGTLAQDEFFPRPQGLGASPEETVALLMTFDKNGDGVLVTDEVPERMRGIFRRGDRNHDGKLTPEEIKAMAGREGLPTGPVKAGMASGMLRQDPVISALDANHDGVIDASEITRSPAALLSLDKNGDGKLTADEIEVRHATVAERADHMLDEWDSDKDGKIAKAEAPDRMQQQFGKLDLNGNGYLERSELEEFFANAESSQGRPNNEVKP